LSEQQARHHTPRLKHADVTQDAADVKLMLLLLIDDDVDDTADADTPRRADIITAYCVLITDLEALYAMRARHLP